MSRHLLKSFSFITLFLLLANYVLPVATLAAEEIQLTQEQQVSESKGKAEETIEKISEEESKPEESQGSITPEAISTSIEEEVSAGKYSSIKVGELYRAKENAEVTIKFTKLPSLQQEIGLEIIKANLDAADQFVKNNAVSPAFEFITTPELEAGSFEAEITMPVDNEDGQKLEVKYSENSRDYFTEEQITTADPHRVSFIVDHFTIFVVVNPNPAGNGNESNDTCSTATVGGSEVCYDTIQAAIDAAASGDTINIQAGTYIEQLSINGKNLTINTVGSVVVQAPAPLNAGANGMRSIIELLGGANVVMSNITVQGPGNSGCNSINYGIYVVDGSHLQISNSSILTIRDNPISGCQNGVGIRVGSMAYLESGSLNATNLIINGYQKGGIVIDGVSSSAVVADSTITGAGEINFIAQNGLQVSRGATATLTNNTISGNSYVNAGDATYNRSSAGILLYYAGDNVIISNNHLSGNDNSIYVDNVGTNLAVEGNTFGAGNFFDLNYYDDANLIALNNDWSEDTYDGIEQKIAHDCENSPFFTGTCNGDDDYDVDMGSVQYAIGPTADLQVCKQDTFDNPLSGWTMSLLGERLIDHTLTNSEVQSGAGYSTGNLSAGQYFVRVSGTYSFWPSAGSGAGVADAGYSLRPPFSPYSYHSNPTSTWVSGDNLPVPALNQGTLEIKINSTNINWGSFNGGHVYTTSFTHAGGAMNFSLYDNAYGDNSNIDLKVEVFSTTSFSGATLSGRSAGCVQFEDVPFGDYYLAEEMQNGWAFVSLEADGTSYDQNPQLITINGDATYTFINEDLTPESSVEVCKVDTAGNPLPGWTMNLSSYQEIFNQQLSAASYTGINTPVLEAGKTYQVLVNGTWSNTGYVSTEQVDTNYASANGSWSSVYQYDSTTGGWDDRLLKVVVDDSQINWGAYTSSHTYSTLLSGDGSSKNIKIFDYPVGSNDTGWYNDNYGELNVRVIELQNTQSVVTGDNGCATFSTVPFGNYLLTENQVEEWQFVSLDGDGGQIWNGQVNLDNPNETFTFTNQDLTPPDTTAPIVSIGNGNDVTPQNAPGLVGTPLANTPANTSPAHNSLVSGVFDVFATVQDDHIANYHFRIIKDGQNDSHGCGSALSDPANQGFGGCGYQFNQVGSLGSSITNQLIASIDTHLLAGGNGDYWLIIGAMDESGNRTAGPTSQPNYWHTDPKIKITVNNRIPEIDFNPDFTFKFVENQACGIGNALSDDGLQFFMSNWNSNYRIEGRFYVGGGSFGAPDAGWFDLWNGTSGWNGGTLSVDGSNNATFTVFNTGNSPSGNAGWQIRIMNNGTELVRSGEDEFTYEIFSDVNSRACGAAEISFYKVEQYRDTNESATPLATENTWQLEVTQGEVTVGTINNYAGSTQSIFDRTGSYDHLLIAPGDYRISEIEQDGYAFTWGRCMDITEAVPNNSSYYVDVDSEEGDQYAFGPQAANLTVDAGTPSAWNTSSNRYGELALEPGQRVYCVLYNEPIPSEPLFWVEEDQSAVRISWNTVDNADGYHVYRNGALVDPAALSCSGNSCIDNNVTVNTTYNYLVTAFNNFSGESAVDFNKQKAATTFDIVIDDSAEETDLLTSGTTSSTGDWQAYSSLQGGSADTSSASILQNAVGGDSFTAGSSGEGQTFTWLTNASLLGNYEILVQHICGEDRGTARYNIYRTPSATPVNASPVEISQEYDPDSVSNSPYCTPGNYSGSYSGPNWISLGIYAFNNTTASVTLTAGIEERYIQADAIAFRFVSELAAPTIQLNNFVMNEGRLNEVNTLANSNLICDDSTAPGECDNLKWEVQVPGGSYKTISTGTKELSLAIDEVNNSNPLVQNYQLADTFSKTNNFFVDDPINPVLRVSFNSALFSGISDTANVTIVNTLPIVTLTATAGGNSVSNTTGFGIPTLNVTAGQQVTFSGNFSDMAGLFDGGPGWQARMNYGGTGFFGQSVSAPINNTNYAITINPATYANGTYNVVLRICEENNLYGFCSTANVVLNVTGGTSGATDSNGNNLPTGTIGTTTAPTGEVLGIGDGGEFDIQLPQSFEVVAGESEVFSISSVGADLANLVCTWDFGDGTVITTEGVDQSRPEHTYSSEGNYILTVTCRGADGSSATSQSNVNVARNPNGNVQGEDTDGEGDSQDGSQQSGGNTLGDLLSNNIVLICVVSLVVLLGLLLLASLLSSRNRR